MSQVGFVPESGSEFLHFDADSFFIEIFRLFFGTLPKLKSSWKSEVTTQRDAYYVSLTAITDIRVEIMSVSRIWYDNYLLLFLDLQILLLWITHCVLRTNNYMDYPGAFTLCLKMNRNRSVNAR